MLKFVLICALLATASAQRHGHQGHGHAQARGFASARGVSKSAHAAVSSDDVHAEVISAASEVRPDGFAHHLETTNGIRAQASGDAYGNIQGDFQWVSPEGEHIVLSYVADENGYQPNSDVLPTPPPIPDAILKSLEYIASHPPKEEVHQQVRHQPAPRGRRF